MLSNKQWQFLETLEDKEYRQVFAEEHVGTGLAFQIRRMREARDWTQENVAEQTGKAQETISQWENPNYGRYSLSTLKELAGAFDVGLLVRFVAFSELAEWSTDVAPERLAPASYEDERQLTLWESGAGDDWEPSSTEGIEDKLIRSMTESTSALTDDAWIEPEPKYAAA